MHAFYQLLLAAVLVFLAALWRHGRGAALRYALAGVAVGVVFVQVLGPFYTRVMTYPVGTPLDDPQGAIAFLPAFQVGLYLALWVAAFAAVGWGWFLAGLAVLGLTQTPIDELHRSRAKRMTPRARRSSLGGYRPAMIFAAGSSAGRAAERAAARPGRDHGRGIAARAAAPSDACSVEIVGRHTIPHVMKQAGARRDWRVFAPVNDTPVAARATLRRRRRLQLADPEQLPSSAAAADLLARHLLLSPAGARSRHSPSRSPRSYGARGLSPAIAQIQWNRYTCSRCGGLDQATPAAAGAWRRAIAITYRNFYRLDCRGHHLRCARALMARDAPAQPRPLRRWGHGEPRAHCYLRSHKALPAVTSLPPTGLRSANRPVPYSAKWWSLPGAAVAHPVLAPWPSRLDYGRRAEGLREQQVSIGGDRRARDHRRRRGVSAVAAGILLYVHVLVTSRSPTSLPMSPEGQSGRSPLSASALLYDLVPMLRSSHGSVVVQLWRVLAGIGLDRLRVPHQARAGGGHRAGALGRRRVAVSQPSLGEMCPRRRNAG